MARADTDATVSPRLPAAEGAAERGPARGRLSGPLGSAAWTLGCIVVLTAVVWSQHPEIFRTPIYAGGDEGVNSLLVIRAEHFSQLTGNYSRVGFHHPGAALIYMLTAGEVVFHNLMHIAPSFYNAQILGVTVYSVTLLVLTAGALGRLARSRWVGTVAVAAGFLFMSAFPWLSAVWFPYLYAPAFLAFTVAAALVAAGRTRELPLAALAGGILVHGSRVVRPLRRGHGCGRDGRLVAGPPIVTCGRRPAGPGSRSWCRSASSPSSSCRSSCRRCETSQARGPRT